MAPDGARFQAPARGATITKGNTWDSGYLSKAVKKVIHIYRYISIREMYKRYGSIAPTHQRFEERKQHYRTRRDQFRGNPRSTLELEAWRNKDSNFDYQLLLVSALLKSPSPLSAFPLGKVDVVARGIHNGSQKSFIPPALVGKPSYGGAIRGKTDTFFSEYATHNAPDLILSESAHSYIIGNLASYDSRQYPSAPPDKRPEGQAFAHTLVIPKARVYNIVDPAATADNCFLVREMRAHFLRFWARPDGKAKILARTKRALDEQDRKLLASSDNNNDSNGDSYASVRAAVFDHFEAMKPAFERLREDDFLFGFHCFPENSIGHLHMHVFPHGEPFRAVSTKQYDWKTVPLQAVLEVETEDGNCVGGGE
ncbi:MAG: hypothetical protein LQ346_002158 [Caloplaca aetnensis]|nr:MAG: hypothetical protein LQ346_002158 [Caloplaca aetnensis]